MPVVFTHCIDAWTFCFNSLSLCLSLCLSLSLSLSFSFAFSFSFSFSLSLSLSLSAGAGRDRAKSETGLSSLVPDQQRSSSCFPVCSVGFPIAHLSFVCLSHGGSRAPISQNHAQQVVDSGLSPNSGQVIEDGSRNPAKVLVSEHAQQSSASNLTLPQQHDQQTGIQTQSASSLDQPQNGLVKYRPSGNNPEPLTADALGQYQPAGNNETPPAGAKSNSTAIVNAQLTPIISRDDDAQRQDAPRDQDAPMPDAPTVHDIATPRRTIGGRCRKWCTSLPQENASVLPVVCEGHDSVMVKHVSNSGAIVKPTITTCIHTVSTGVFGHDHELLPKQSTDQDAVDAVTRQRDNITRTAADTEALLLFTQDPDQASTPAPLDDEQVMNFQWFEHVAWDLRGTSYVQPPTRFKPSFTTSLASESAWKALVLSSWLFLGRPAVNASESNCAHFLDARLELFC